MSAKKYLSKAWLYRQFVVLKRDADAIAEECGVNRRTIYRKLEDFGIVKKR
jgi:transcriptional regulator of acetoin/glycerol metabolism